MVPLTPWSGGSVVVDKQSCAGLGPSTAGSQDETSDYQLSSGLCDTTYRLIGGLHNQFEHNKGKEAEASGDSSRSQSVINHLFVQSTSTQKDLYSLMERSAAVAALFLFL